MTLGFDCSDPTQRADGLAAAKTALLRGELVVLPTDTVYGLGADAFSTAGILALLTAKGRGRDMPVPVLVSGPRVVDGLAYQCSKAARDLMQAFWPGPLTVIVKAQPTLSWDLGDVDGTVALRMPLHPVAIELLRETGPLGVSSANRTGRPPATTVDEARDQLEDAVSVYLDGGPCAAAVPSTIVDATGDVPRVRRLGAIGVELLVQVVPNVEVD